MTVAEAPADTGATWFDGAPPPSRGDEAWRHTPVDAITRRLREVELAPVHSVATSLVEELAGRHGAVQAVLVNGVLAGPHDELPTTPDGMRLSTGGAGELRIDVDPGVEVSDPVHIVHLSKPSGRWALARPRVTVSVGDRSRLHLVESHVGLAGGAITEAATSVEVGVGAQVVHHRVQHEPDDAIHLGRVAFHQGRDSQVASTSVSLGAAVARLAVDTVLGAGATCDLRGLHAPRGDQHHDTVVTVDHAASHATSSQVFKGVIDDRAYGAFSGHVIVRPGTVATNAHQLNRNLLLAPTAQADSRPWLEIFADDVRCDHGSATGRLDDDALFYLRSRGIPVAQARSILVDAFVRDVTASIPLLSLRDHVERLLGLDGAR